MPPAYRHRYPHFTPTRRSHRRSDNRHVTNRRKYTRKVHIASTRHRVKRRLGAYRDPNSHRRTTFLTRPTMKHRRRHSNRRSRKHQFSVTTTSRVTSYHRSSQKTPRRPNTRRTQQKEKRLRVTELARRYTNRVKGIYLNILKQARMTAQHQTVQRLRQQRHRILMQRQQRRIISSVRPDNLLIITLRRRPKHFKGINISRRLILNPQVLFPTNSQFRVRQARFPTPRKVLRP